MVVHLRPLMQRPIQRFCITATRSFYYKFERFYTPPLQKAKESPYVVGPVFKPDYLPREYITEAIKEKHDDDFNYLIYKPTKIEFDATRTVKLLLIEDVEGLGVAGQVVDAPFRFGSSKLVAMKKAEYATDFAQKWYKFGPKSMQSASSALSPRTARLLKTQIFRLPISREINVEPWHLSLALRMAGCLCPTQAIEKDSITEYTDEENETLVKCVVRINNHERVEVRFAYEASEKTDES